MPKRYEIVITCHNDGLVKREILYAHGDEMEALSFYIGISPQIDALEVAVKLAANEITSIMIDESEAKRD